MNQVKNTKNKIPVNTLGYTLTALDPSVKPVTIDPTFLPTFNEFQMCPWKTPDGKTGQGLSNNNNCFCYLQMTKGDDPPTNLHYDYTGNLVDEFESGTLFVSRKLFWDKWLLPKLTTVNFNTYLEAISATCDNDEINPNWQYAWKIGKDSATRNGRLDDQDPFYAWTPKTVDSDPVWPYGFRWTPPSTDYVDNEGSWGAYLKAELECTTLSL